MSTVAASAEPRRCDHIVGLKPSNDRNASLVSESDATSYDFDCGGEFDWFTYCPRCGTRLKEE